MTILAIDDDPSQTELIRIICQKLDYPKVRCLSAEGKAAGLALARAEVVDLILTDLRLPDGSGFEVLRESKALNPLVPVVVMTAYEDAREAVSLLKEGADDYLVKPTRREEIERLILRVNEKFCLMSESLLPSPEAHAPPAAPDIIYRGEAMARVLSVAARSAPSSAPILVSGESGTGKELVARFIHERSGRSGPFVPVNVSALPESLAESELFGHRRGSFTGAESDRTGRFEEANGGTLFLDEIGDISLPLQVKLLRAIQFGEIERVGENRSRKIDARIVAATHRDLRALVAEGRFRQDLFYRLNVIEVTLPPLRDRKADIRPLAESFLAAFAARDRKEVKGITREAMDALMKRSFPGNIRELENLMERAVVLCRGDHVRLEDLAPEILDRGEGPGACADQAAGLPYEEAMAEFERSLLQSALDRASGNKSAAARELGIGERHLRSRLERLGMR